MLTKNSLEFEIKQLTEAGTFEGWASVYNVVDSYGDIVMPGAFSKTISENNSQIVILNQHNQREPIGLGTLEDQQKGLWIKGELNLDLRAAQEAYSNVKKRILKGLSIGYETLADQMDRAKNARQLLELKLHEVSLVTFQACPGALVQGVKAIEDINTIRDLEEFLRESGLPKAAAVALVAKAKQVVRRDADDTDKEGADIAAFVAACRQIRNELSN